VIDPANTSRDIYADKGYVDGQRAARLKQSGLRMHIQRKGSKDKPLSEAQERRNKRIASLPYEFYVRLRTPFLAGNRYRSNQSDPVFFRNSKANRGIGETR